jgi:acetylornithine/N-succinyldiaminopimelate aminotransferase
MEKAVGERTAAVILEPVQGEGGVNVPSPGYLSKVSEICKRNGAYLIVDEIQTGFFRTGMAFAFLHESVEPDFVTMAKGIAGGFPFAAFAFTMEVMEKLETGDHGGTYCGNPLGCAVSHDVIKFMLDNDIGAKVEKTGRYALELLNGMKDEFKGVIRDARGKGLLLALEFFSPEAAAKAQDYCFRKRVLVNVTHGTVIRLFPALTIGLKDMKKGLDVIRDALAYLDS